MDQQKLNDLTSTEFADKFVEAIRAEANRNKGSWPRLISASNGALTYSWLNQFANRRIKTPHIDKAAALGLLLGYRLSVNPSRHFNIYQP